MLVKNPTATDHKIFYLDIGDYLSREEKLARIKNLHTVLSDEFKIITPNDKGDWINQRGNEFENYLPLAPERKFDTAAQSFFIIHYRGVETNRDPLLYNYSRSKLEKNVRCIIEAHDCDTLKDIYNFGLYKTTIVKDKKKNTVTTTTYKSLLMPCENGKMFEAIYRPFCKQNLYEGFSLIHRGAFLKKILFPTDKEENLLICLTSGEKFSALIADKIVDLHFNGDTQCFPLYWYEPPAQGNLFGEDYERHDGVSDFILKQARQIYGDAVTKEDIFYYV